MGSKYGVGKPMENPADVILVSSRIAGKVRSIDCHVVTGHIYVSEHYKVCFLLLRSGAIN